MARHNEVTLYGQVSSPPLLLRESSQDPDSRLCRVLSSFTVIRGIRDFGAKDQRMRLDELVVMPRDTPRSRGLPTCAGTQKSPTGSP